MRKQLKPVSLKLISIEGLIRPLESVDKYSLNGRGSGPVLLIDVPRPQTRVPHWRTQIGKGGGLWVQTPTVLSEFCELCVCKIYSAPILIKSYFLQEKVENCTLMSHFASASGVLRSRDTLPGIAPGPQIPGPALPRGKILCARMVFLYLLPTCRPKLLLQCNIV